MVSKSSSIRVGVVGYGGAFNMGRKHLQEMQGAGMTPVAVAEIDPERLEQAELDFPGIATFDSVDAMLKGSDVELVTVITPHDTHAPLGEQILKAGRHCVLEKPMAVTTAECDRLIKTAERNGLVVSTYHNRHWDGSIMRAVKEIGAGKIGEVLRIASHTGTHGQPLGWWRSSKRISGGVLYDWGVHLLEYSFQLIDSEIVEVSGYAHQGYWASKVPWGEDTNEDEATVHVRFASGQHVALSISQINANPGPFQIEVWGTKGYYGFSVDNWKMIQPKTNGQVVTTTGRSPKAEGYRFYENIAAHLAGEAELVITPQWARRPIHVLDLAGRSAAEGKTLKAKYG